MKSYFLRWKRCGKSAFSPFLVTIILLAMAAGCKKDGASPIEDGPTAIEYIQSDTGLETLSGLLEELSLAGTLSGAEALAIFAPTDEAFNALPEGYWEGLTGQQKGDFLRYHIYMGTLTINTEVPGENRQLASLHGDDLFIQETIAGGVVNGTYVIESNIEVSNGHIHKVNELLYPDAFGTVYENLAKRYDYGGLAGMFDLMGLSGTLEGDGPLTLVAPARASVEALEGFMGIDITDQEWGEILNYHLVKEDLTEYAPMTVRALKTESGDSSYLEVWQSGSYVINNNTVSASPVISSNGVIMFLPESELPDTYNLLPGILMPDSYLSVPNIMYKRFSLKTVRGAFAVAGLNITLYDLDEEFTVFVAKDNTPGTNTLPSGTMLAELLKYHVLPVKLTAADLQHGQSYTTLQGETLTITKSGNDIFVNGNAKIVLADLEGRNGVVHVINRMLELPQ